MSKTKFYKLKQNTKRMEEKIVEIERRILYPTEFAFNPKATEITCNGITMNVAY